MSMDPILDFRGLRCPLPVLKARKAIKSMAPGAVVTILLTDPSAPEDFKDFCRISGHSWVRVESLADHSALTLVLKS
ncbi:MAG: sulfurtransferase TusA family protein [Alphaproteobacteria bacterium]